MHLEAARRRVEPVGVGDAAHREQHDLGLDVARATGTAETDPPDVAGALRRRRGRRQPHVVPVPRDLGVALRDLDLVVAQQRLTALHLGHRHAERREHVRHLAGDEAPADDRHPGREGVQPHHGVGGVHPVLGVGRAQAVDVEADGVAPGGDDEPVGGHLLAGREGEATLAGEGGVGAVQGGVLLPAAVGLAAGRDRVDPPEDAVADGRPVDRGLREGHAEPVGLVRLEHPVGGQHEHLRRDAADVQAGAPEGAALDDRDVEAVELRDQQRVARTAADDDQVVVRHGRQRRRRPSTGSAGGDASSTARACGFRAVRRAGEGGVDEGRSRRWVRRR